MKGFDIYSVKFWIVGLVGIIILVLCGVSLAVPDAEKMISALQIVVTSGVRG